MSQKTNPILSVHNISVGYGKKAIVHNVCLDIFPGKLYALLGLNGSGKTTLLKALCGLLPTLSGSFNSGGIDITRLDEKKRAKFISYIPQRHSKLIGLTVLEAVLMGLNPELGIFENISATNKTKAINALEKLQISHFANNDFSQLSEGQKQLVILARTLVQDAPIMLMDEPDSALDFPGKHRILEKIRNLIHTDSKTGLITLHDPNLALNYCDHLILLHEGQVCSEIDLRAANKDEIEKSLSAIYRDIVLTELDGKYVARIHNS
jgi:iron complex transport system ATP-binding protein